MFAYPTIKHFTMAWNVLCLFYDRQFMMTSSNWDTLCVTDALWGESIIHRRIPLTKAGEPELWFLLDKRWDKQRDAGDLRCHLAHYDVTVMCSDGAAWDDVGVLID